MTTTEIPSVTLSSDPVTVQLLRQTLRTGCSLEPPDPYITDALRDWADRSLDWSQPLVVDEELAYDLERWLYERTADDSLPAPVTELWRRLPVRPEWRTARRLEQDGYELEDALGEDHPAVLLFKAAYLEGGELRRVAMRKIAEGVYQAIDQRSAVDEEDA